MSVENGGRLDLLREAATEADGRVSYAVTLTTPMGKWSGRSTVTLVDGAVSFGPWPPGPPPPEWLVATARSLLRNAWKDRRAEGAAPWPERFTRWRPSRD